MKISKRILFLIIALTFTISGLIGAAFNGKTFAASHELVTSTPVTYKLSKTAYEVGDTIHLDKSVTGGEARLYMGNDLVQVIGDSDITGYQFKSADAGGNFTLRIFGGSPETELYSQAISVKAVTYTLKLPSNTRDIIPNAFVKDKSIVFPLPQIFDRDNEEVDELAYVTIEIRQGSTTASVPVVLGEVGGISANASSRTWTPTETGIYRVTYVYSRSPYSTTLAANNIDIQNKTQAQLDDITYEKKDVVIQGTIPTSNNVRFGQEYTLPSLKMVDSNKVLAKDGVMKTYTEIDVICTDANNDEHREIITDFKWTPKIAGSYRFVYRVYDILSTLPSTSNTIGGQRDNVGTPIFHNTAYEAVRNVTDTTAAEFKFVSPTEYTKYTTDYTAAYNGFVSPEIPSKDLFNDAVDATNWLPVSGKVAIGETFKIPATISYDYGTAAHSIYKGQVLTNTITCTLAYYDSAKSGTDKWESVDATGANGLNYDSANGLTFTFDTGNTALQGITDLVRKWRLTWRSTDYFNIISTAKTIEFEVVDNYEANYKDNPKIGVNDDSSEFRVNKEVLNLGEILTFPVLTATSKNTKTENIAFEYEWTLDNPSSPSANWLPIEDIENGSVRLEITEDIFDECKGLYTSLYIRATAKDWFALSTEPTPTTHGTKSIIKTVNILNPEYKDTAPAFNATDISNWKNKVDDLNYYMELENPEEPEEDGVNEIIKKSKVWQYETITLPQIRITDTHLDTVLVTGVSKSGKAVGDLTSVPPIVSGACNINNLKFFAHESGKFTFTYIAKDVAGNTAIFVTTIDIVKKEPPVFRIVKTTANTEAQVGQAIPLAGIIVTDEGMTSSDFDADGKIYGYDQSGVKTYMGELSINHRNESNGPNGVVQIGRKTFYANAIGTYTIEYKVTDAVGNESTTQSYTVEVTDGKDNIQIEVNTTPHSGSGKYTILLDNDSSEAFPISLEELKEVRKNYNKSEDTVINNNLAKDYSPFYLPKIKVSRIISKDANAENQSNDTFVTWITVTFTNGDAGNNNREILNTKTNADMNKHDNGYYELTPNGSWEENAREIADGTYTITYHATSNLTGTTNSRSWTVKMGDVTDPTIELTNAFLNTLPKNAKTDSTFEINRLHTGIVINDESFPQSSSNREDNLKKYLTITVYNPNGGVVTSQSGTVGSPTEFVNVYDVEEVGTYRIEFTVKDRAGNTSRHNVTFTVEGETAKDTLTATQILGIVFLVLAVAAFIGVIIYFWKTRPKGGFRTGKEKSPVAKVQAPKEA